MLRVAQSCARHAPRGQVVHQITIFSPTLAHNPCCSARFASGARRRNNDGNEHWEAVRDPGTGQVYWWNTATSETTALGAPKPVAHSLAPTPPAEPPVPPSSPEALPGQAAANPDLYKSTSLADQDQSSPLYGGADDGHWWRKCRASSLSGGEMYCLRKVGYEPNQFVLGNTAQSMGIAKGFLASWSATAGGSNKDIQELIANSRQVATQRLYSEALERGGVGVVGTALGLTHKSSHYEVLAVGTTVHATDKEAYRRSDGKPFTVGCSGSELFCLLDARFEPRGLVFGNEAYSRGLTGFLTSAVSSTLMSGFVPAITDVFQHAREAALSRLREQAFADGCNFVSGVRMQAMNFSFVQEVAFRGTACVHPAIPTPRNPSEVCTSGLAEFDLWSALDCGFVPVGVVNRVAVFNVGFGGQMASLFQELSGGEVDRYTQVLNHARRQVMSDLRDDCLALGGEEVMGVQFKVNEIASGLLEFNAYGTAIQRRTGFTNKSAVLPPQAAAKVRAPFTEGHGLRHMDSVGEGGGGNKMAESNSAASAQAEAGWKFITVLLNFINKLLKK